MNRKTIKSILKRKFNDWVKTIDDEDLRANVQKNTIITGGAIVSLLLNDDPKDYDVYFTNKETCKKVAEYYVNKWNNEHDKKAYILDGTDDFDNFPVAIDALGEIWETMTEDRLRIVFSGGGVASENDEILEEPFEDAVEALENVDEEPAGISNDNQDDKPPYRPVFLSPNAITLSDKIQIVIRFHGDASEIHKNYDFAHCTNYWTSGDGELVLQQPALESILAKHLIYNGSKYPVCSVIRMRKFIKRGWHINAGQILKMLFQVSELDLTDIAVLEDQLVGVDSAYFMQLISALQVKMNNDPEFQISSEYVTSIIDKVFG